MNAAMEPNYKLKFTAQKNKNKKNSNLFNDLY